MPDIYSELNDALNNSSSLDARITPNKATPPNKGQINVSAKINVYRTCFYYVKDIDNNQNASQMTSAYSILDLQKLAIANVPQFIKDSKFPVPVFGNNDYAGGFKATFEKMPVLPSSIQLLGYNIVGAGNSGLHIEISSGLDAAQLYKTAVSLKSSYSQINGQAKKGDLVFTYLCSESLQNGIVKGGAGQYGYTEYFYLVDVVISCNTLAYGSLLNELNSDKLNLSYIRYTLPTEVNLDQFDQDILLIKSGLLGAEIKDQLAPKSFDDGTTYKKNIINIPLTKGIDKHNVLATTLSPFNEQFTWVIFFNGFEKA